MEHYSMRMRWLYTLKLEDGCCTCFSNSSFKSASVLCRSIRTWMSEEGGEEKKEEEKEEVKRRNRRRRRNRKRGRRRRRTKGEEEEKEGIEDGKVSRRGQCCHAAK